MYGYPFVIHARIIMQRVLDIRSAGLFGSDGLFGANRKVYWLDKPLEYISDTKLTDEQLIVFNFFDSIFDIFLNISNFELHYAVNWLSILNDFSSVNTLVGYNTRVINDEFISTSLYLDYFYHLNNLFDYYFSINNDFNAELMFNFYYLHKFAEYKYFYNTSLGYIFNNQIVSHNIWSLLLLVLLVFYCILVWSYVFFGGNFSKNFDSERSYDEYNNIVSYTVESEKELGAVDDMFVGISVLICIYGWFFFGTIFFNFFSSISLQYVYIGFPLFICCVLGMPSNMLWNYGILFPVFLRGSSNTTIFILEFMYDVLATTIMFIRLIVQNIRFLLMFFAFFECYEFFYNFIFIVKNSYFFDLSNNSQDIFYVFITNFLNLTIFYTYNIFHLMYTIVSHFFAYIVLVFWFFSFLYTTFLNDKLENYFKFKNSIKYNKV